jgi:hypothetical protein
MRVARPLTRWLTVLPAAVVVAAFFLPWMSGSHELRFHEFSGFDFARLIRNFEITASSQSETGQIRATALLIYLMPAMAANAALMTLLESPAGIPRRVATGATALAGGYGLAVLGAMVFLSAVEVNEFADVVGAPRYGFVLSALGCAVLVGCGLLKTRSL